MVAVDWSQLKTATFWTSRLRWIEVRADTLPAFLIALALATLCFGTCFFCLLGALMRLMMCSCYARKQWPVKKAAAAEYAVLRANSGQSTEGSLSESSSG